ncbi:hypothetical protein J2T13_003679 [Paenibacillus sp. DS2015]|uniref:pyocin knob domain-containing protein n=1 Tax=Paenibacillus sp. DS2015 TaxID=3373917 RepID=UPI003D1DFB8A
MSTNTEHLELLKKDPTLDQNDTFNIKTMMNDNWDKIDEAVERVDAAAVVVNDNVADLQTDVTDVQAELSPSSQLTSNINAGSQVIQGVSAPALAFPRVVGRTLINMFGDLGKGDKAVGFTQVNSVLTAQSDGSLKISTVASAPNFADAYLTLPRLNTAKRYLLAGEVKNDTADSVGIYVQGRGSAIISTDKTKFNFIYQVITNPPLELFILRVNSSVVGASGYFKGLRLYEITAQESAEIAGMTADQVATKYPYVGTGVHGIKDVTISSIQDNLLPALSEWEVFKAGTAKVEVISPYVAKLTSMGDNNYGQIYTSAPIIAGKSYTLGGTIDKPAGALDALFIYWADNNNVRLVTEGQAERKFKGTHIAPAEAHFIHAHFTVDIRNESQTLTNPMLTEGNTPQPFKPQSKTILTAYTELYSNTDGSIADKMEYISGKYQKIKRWSKKILDGSYSWAIDPPGTTPTSKRLFVRGPETVAETFVGVGTKFDGKPLENLTSVAIGTVDSMVVYANGVLLDVPNADSGWGPSYTPTVAEIKAYFYGWTMRTTAGAIWDGSAGDVFKRWYAKWSDGAIWSPTALNTFSVDKVPKALAPAGYTPYQVLIKPPTSSTEAIQTSGAIVLESGDNSVTVKSTNVPINPSTLTHADTFYNALSDAERAIAANSEAGAMLLGGIKPERFIYGDTKRASSNWTYGVNNITKGGLYYVEIDLSDLPYAQGGFVLHEAYSFHDEIATQTFTPYGQDKKYYRGKVDGVWKPWTEIWTTANNTLNLSINGLRKSADGFIEQWGVVLANPGVATSVVFPVAFNTIFNFVATGVCNPAVAVSVPSALNNSIEFLHGASSPIYIHWRAIGK